MVDEPETLGSYLKNQRESKKISLREIAKNTRVREHILRAIEEDRHELLPPSTYVKGFLSAYAKYLRLDENEVLLRYESLLKREAPTPSRAELVKPLSPPSRPKQKISPAQPSKPKKEILWNAKQIWVVGGVIAVSLILLYFFSPYSSRPPEPVLEKPVSEKATVKEEAAAPAPPVAAETSVPEEKPVIEGKESLAAPPPVTSTGSVPEKKALSLRLKAVEQTWVSLEVDGQSEKQMTLKPGEDISVQGSNRVRMTLGNAGGLDLILNGKVLEKFGKSGEVLTLIFTLKGVEVKRPEKPNPPKE